MLDDVGTRGPLPLPPNVRALRGGKATRRPSPVRAAPEAPDWLSREAKAEWRRVTPELERIGLLSKLDRSVLAEYASTWAHWVTVSRLLDREAAPVPDPTHPDRPAAGLRKHPMWSVYVSLSGQLSSLARELGLSPNARARMAFPESEPTDADGILD